MQTSTLTIGSDERLLPYRVGIDGPFGAAEARHLLGRSSFGASPSALKELQRRGLEAGLEEIFEDEEESGSYRSTLKLGDRLAKRGDIDGLKAQWALRFLRSRHGLRERLALFWHDHFATSNTKVADAALMQRQNELWRSEGMGSFATLLEKALRDPALLIWLDADRNLRRAPNENFARELFELFSLGLGGFDETDVREAARAFTGWGVEQGRFRFERRQHDPGDEATFRRCRSSSTGRTLGRPSETTSLPPLRRGQALPFLCRHRA